MLHGRADECLQVSRALGAARGGRGAVLVIVGEPGTGKTALLEHAAGVAEGFSTRWVEGVESESEIAFAGLSELVRPYVDRLPDLPPPQRRALESAMALRDDPVSALAVGSGLLSLICLLADEQPLLCLVDDAQWVDGASLDALLFASRRLDCERAVVVVAARPAPGTELAGRDFARVELGPLGQDEARLVVEDLGVHRASDVTRLVEAADGNPLAIVELSRALSRRADGPLDDDGPIEVGDLVTAPFLREVSALPPATRQALLVVAACDSVDQALIHSAVEVLVGDLAVLEPAYVDILVASPTRGPRFRHPLLRSAVYHAAPAEQRRAAHAAIATAARDEHDRRAWHGALAAAGHDDDTAAELVRTASHARRRGGHQAEARALERAAALSSSRARAGRLWFEAGSAAILCGRHDWARRLLDLASGAAPGDDILAADIAFERARLALWHDAAEEPGMLEVAHRLAEVDVVRAARLASYGIVGRLSDFDGRGLARLAARTEAYLGDATDPRDAAFKLAYARVALGRTDSGLALADAATRDALAVDDVTTLTQLGQLYTWVERYDDALVVLDRAVASCRMSGAHWMLVNALVHRAGVHRRTGRLLVALADAAEAGALADQVGVALQRADVAAALALVEAELGRTVEARAHGQEVLRAASAMRTGAAELQVAARCALGSLELSQGRHEEAGRHLTPVLATLRDGGFAEVGACPAVVDLVEVHARAGRAQDATSLADELDDFATPRSRSGLRAATARGRALVDPLDGAAFERAADLARSAGEALGAARTSLYHGEWLRRSRRIVDARPVLADAYDAFLLPGAKVWAERAAAELRATGAPVDSMSANVHQLTPQELQVALQAAAGARNREIAGQLYVSEKTVEAHLSRVFRKLGVRSRAQLGAALAPEGRHG